MPRNEDERLDETTALLPAKEPKPVTPLPRLQIGILLLLQLAEPITSQCIYPFINQLVSELDITGGDEKKVGYYAGMIESVFFLTEAMFVLQWSRISDYIGRKPVLLTGMAGLCMSMICFGISKTFLHLVLSRCLVGALNGNIGVIKSMMGELTDSTNMAQGFALMPVVWSAGATLGPMIGGQLAKPHDRWPNLFTAPIWTQYPYLLPCAVSASFSAFTFVIASIFLKETVQRRHSKQKSVRILVQAEEDPLLREESLEDPATLRSLMVRPVLLSVLSYGTLCLLDIAYRAIQPLFFSTPIALGGLGFTPATIGLVLGIFGLLNGSLQALFFARVIRRWGPKRVFMAGMACFVPLFGMFPVINALARPDGLTYIVWAAIVLQLTISVVMDMSFAASFMFVTTSAPNKRSLGATNGVAQVIAALLRSVGPASATSLFALSLEHNWLGGKAVYVILMLTSCVLWFVAIPLPYDGWTRNW
ncbi:MFS general substrate transporter [Rhodofomes roseus]|uniref:MFS general substrate transporter n=1 Tax=Rhodofomes roseus TaxID=34475 RepID=A0ABQ8KJX5_9APHY|nr:MFS general substrate transporter [Rhodofomes roseus]KAH9838448.1 MFS general substrate transporter [Rhodofomes roseus]